MVIAILGILAGVGTVAYTGYVQRANKAVDQQMVADIAYSLELAAAAGEFNSVEPPVRLGDDDLGLIPVGYVSLSKGAPCATYSIAHSEDGGYTAAPDENGVIAKALAASFGSDYSDTLRLHYDWSGSTASGTESPNLLSASFMADVDSLWDKVQSLSNTVYEKARDNFIVQYLMQTTFTSDYDVLSQSASPLAYLNQSAQGRTMVAQWWCEAGMGTWMQGNKEALLAEIKNNGGPEMTYQQFSPSNCGSVYARNTCMVNYILTQIEGGACSDPNCLTHKASDPSATVTVMGQTFGAMTGTAMGEALMCQYPVDSSLFCSTCLPHAKTYLSEYAANDALCFLEVMKVVKQTDGTYTGEEPLTFAYYEEYINAVKGVYGALAAAKGETGNAVVAVYYSGGQLSVDCSPVELGSFYTGETPSSSAAAPTSNVVKVVITQNEDGSYSFACSGVMTLDLNGSPAGYAEAYFQDADGTLTEVDFGDYVSTSTYSGMNFGNVFTGPTELKGAGHSLQFTGKTVGHGTISYSAGGKSLFEIVVSVVDSSGE